jgi:hypothetical protein
MFTRRVAYKLHTCLVNMGTVEQNNTDSREKTENWYNNNEITCED